eukprot:gnl/Hemi2/20059_TR6653_c0_g1_i1.p2 gnl/Hemi2/20059_TR6653_c0_g1~~gnl/Hemi2/20059_TR6653_c0_g1_i1.p2  ORF type:complete len:160 (-),score=32.47 gnl/Hemi2/20059_TR6653_c0_g1_i1:62-541(-)
MQIGDMMEFQGPRGGLQMAVGSVVNLGMIAKGTGIIPMLQTLGAYFTYERKMGIVGKLQKRLIFAAEEESEPLLWDQLQALRTNNPGLQIRMALAKPSPFWVDAVGEVSAELVGQMMPPPGPDMFVMVAGPADFSIKVSGILQLLHYSKGRHYSILSSA